ncbi:hypothetical protein [Streptomyces sp. NPDC058401]|uniref:hypothetical protein n=1 Tax=Streptomyces sp. NPDC058401 TaxID=3346480 RepID=UPI00364B4BB1
MALGVAVVPLIFIMGFLVFCVAGSHFLVSQEKRTGCLVVSSSLLFLIAGSVLVFYLETLNLI